MSFLITCLCVKFLVKGTTLMVSGPRNITKANVIAACDLNLIDTVVIDEQINSIDVYAFENMKQLRSLTIGPDLNNFRAEAFRSVQKLEKIIVHKYNTYFITDSYSVLYSKDMNVLYKAPNLLPSTYKIPRSVTRIVAEGMGYLQNINSIFFHKELTFIGVRALWYPKKIN